jgi:hypothetical protein
VCPLLVVVRTMDALSYLQQMFDLAADGKLQGVWFWASLYMLVVCLYSALRQIQTRFWLSTKGKLENLGVEAFGCSNNLSDQQYVGKTLYSYNVDGKVYQGKRISPWVFVTNHNAKGLLSRQQAGIDMLDPETVTVFYNPKNPGKSFLLKANKIGIVGTLIMAIAPLLSYLGRFHA